MKTVSKAMFCLSLLLLLSSACAAPVAPEADPPAEVVASDPLPWVSLATPDDLHYPPLQLLSVAETDEDYMLLVQTWHDDRQAYSHALLDGDVASLGAGENYYADYVA